MKMRTIQKLYKMKEVANDYHRQPLDFIGAPTKIRTWDIQIRSLALYPAEPWARFVSNRRRSIAYNQLCGKDKIRDFS